MATIHSATVSDTLSFEETVRHNQHIVGVRDMLIFAQSDSDFVLDEFVHDHFVIAQALTYTLSTSRTVRDVLSFGDSGRRVHDASVYQNFSFVETADPGNKWPQIVDTFSFFETLVGEPCLVGFDRLLFVQTIHITNIRNRLVEHAFGFGQYATVFRPDAQFSALSPPPIQRASTVTFAAANGTSVTLKAPEFDNSSSLQLRRIQRNTRGQDLIIYRDPAWSEFEDFELEFKFVLYDDAMRFKRFVQATFGFPITYTDFEGTQWTGLILNEDFAVQSNGRFNNGFSVKFEVIFP